MITTTKSLQPIIRRSTTICRLSRRTTKTTTQPILRYYSSSVAAQHSDSHSNPVLTRQPSPYKLGKHRSNALELIQKQPIIEVDSDMAICDGGGGALGHPLEYIKLGHRMDYNENVIGEREEDGVPCIYCGLRYRMKHGAGHH